MLKQVTLKKERMIEIKPKLMSYQNSKPWPFKVGEKTTETSEKEVIKLKQGDEGILFYRYCHFFRCLSVISGPVYILGISTRDINCRAGSASTHLAL